MKRAVQPWHGLPKEVMESPFLKGFNKSVDVTPEDMGQWWLGQCWVGLDGLAGLFQPQRFPDSLAIIPIPLVAV